MRKKCSICRFFREHPYLRKQWQDKVNEAPSLRELSAFLEGLGLKVNRSTVSVHLRICERKELYASRLSKLKKSASRPFKRVSNFFMPTREKTDSEGNVPCYICRNLGKKEDLVFDCLLHVYLCEECFFRRSLEKPEARTRRSVRNTQTLLEKLNEVRRRSKRG